MKNSMLMLSSKKFFEYIFILSVLTVSAVLIFYRLGFQSLNIDEGVTLYFADPDNFSALQIGKAMIASREMHPPGFFIIIHEIIKLLGKSEFSLRFFPAIAGVLNIALVYILAKIWKRPYTGLLAALLLAVSSFNIAISQEARMYSTAIFFNLLAVIFASRWFLLRRIGDIVIYGLFLTVSLYIHYYSILLWFFTGFFFFIKKYLKKDACYNKVINWLYPAACCGEPINGVPRGRCPLVRSAGFNAPRKQGSSERKRTLRGVATPLRKERRKVSDFIAGWLITSIVSFLFFLPWLLIIFKSQLKWATQIYNLNVGIEHLLSGLVQLYTGPAIILPGFLVFLAASCAIIALIVLGIVNLKDGGMFFGILTFGVIFSTFLISAFTKLHIYQTKYLIIILPFFCLLLSEAVISSKSKLFFIVIITSFLIVNFISWRNMTFDPYYGNRDYRLVCAYLSDKAEHDEPIIVLGSMNLPAFYYYYRGKAKIFAVENPNEIFSKKEIILSKHIWVFYYPLLFPNTAEVLSPEFKLMGSKYTRNYFQGNIIIIQKFEHGDGIAK